MKETKTRYQALREKADKCRRCGLLAKSEGARKLWLDHAAKLEVMAGNLPAVIQR